ncbi:30S ribosomal protein S6 [bacterium]|nr:30S ribosomal protein S6 [bacterium]
MTDEIQHSPKANAVVTKDATAVPAATPEAERKPWEPVYVKVDLPPVPPEMLKTTRIYEVFLLFDPTEATKSWDKLVEFVKGLVEGRHGGLVLKTDNWADSRKLAYEIKGLRRGTYMLMYFRAKPAIINTLDAELRLDDRVVRHMIVMHEKAPDQLTGRVRQRAAEDFEEEDFGRRRDDDWGDDDYGYDDD